MVVQARGDDTYNLGAEYRCGSRLGCGKWRWKEVSMCQKYFREKFPVCLVFPTRLEPLREQTLSSGSSYTSSIHYRLLISI